MTRPACKRRGKRAYATREAAMQALVGSYAPGRSPSARRAYQCTEPGCTSWHLTKQLTPKDHQP